MTLNEYQKLAARTINKSLTKEEQEAHALHGLVGSGKTMLDLVNGIVVDPLRRMPSCGLLHERRQILGRYVQPFSVEAHTTGLDIVLPDESDELV